MIKVLIHRADVRVINYTNKATGQPAQLRAAWRGELDEVALRVVTPQPVDALLATEVAKSASSQAAKHSTYRATY